MVSNHELIRCWRAVASSAIPHFSRLLATMPVALLNHLYVGTCDTRGSFVMFEGPGLIGIWGRDVTGRRIYTDMSREFRTRHVTNIRAMHHFGCGWSQSTSVAIPNGNRVLLSSTIVPAKGGLDDSELMVCCCERSEAKLPAHGRKPSIATVQSCWIDLGRGTPEIGPLELTE